MTKSKFKRAAASATRWRGTRSNALPRSRREAKWWRAEAAETSAANAAAQAARCAPRPALPKTDGRARAAS
eukprot:5394895-Pyramimonas_sp.AAC.1